MRANITKVQIGRSATTNAALPHTEGGQARAGDRKRARAKSFLKPRGPTRPHQNPCVWKTITFPALSSHFVNRLPEKIAARTSARGLQGTPLEAHTAWAQSRLDGLRAGTLAPEAVLDIEATARLMALAELTGLADRVLDWQTLRWYLNPISLRLEPVVHLDADRAGPHVRADALLPRLLASAPIRQLFQTLLRAEAERLLAPDTPGAEVAGLHLEEMDIRQ